jgi:uncharacterized coiled-coil protein SlyX
MRQPTKDETIAELKSLLDKQRGMTENYGKQLSALTTRIEGYERAATNESDDVLIHRIAQTAQGALSAALHGALTGYGSPLTELVKRATERRTTALAAIVDAAMDHLIGSDELKQAAIEAARHKLAKMVVTDIEGGMERAYNAFKGDPVRRSRAILAVERAIAGFDKTDGE